MGQITEDEYSRWYSPHAAVEALRVAGYDPQTLYSTILFRVTMDELRTVAEKRITTAKYHNEKTTRLGLLAPGMWEVAGITPSFWDSGDVIFRKQHQASEPTFTYACTGIRFDPAGIEKLVAQKRPPAPDTRTAYNKAGDAVTASLARLRGAYPSIENRGSDNEAEALLDPYVKDAPGLTIGEAMKYFAGDDAPPLTSHKRRANPMTDREIKAWHRGLSKIKKSLGVLALWELAKAAHPGRHLPRKLVEQFGNGRSNGHRPKL